MSGGRGALRWSVTAVLVVALTGCAPPTPEPTPTPTGFASEDEAFAAAEATYRAYVDALNDVNLSDPETFEPVYALTTGDANADERKGLSGYHADGLTVSGASRIALLEPLSWDPSSRVVTLASCFDVSDVEVTDSEGNSVVAEDRPDVQSLTITVMADPPGIDLKIASLTGREGPPKC